MTQTTKNSVLWQIWGFSFDLNPTRDQTVSKSYFALFMLHWFLAVHRSMINRFKGYTIDIWHLTFHISHICMPLLSIAMKTKVVQHVLRIISNVFSSFQCFQVFNVFKFSITFKLWNSWFQAFVWHSDIFIFYLKQ